MATIEVEVIVVTTGPHVADPCDQAPVLLHLKEGLDHKSVFLGRPPGLQGWLFGLGIYLVRRHVRQCVGASNGRS